MLLVVFNPHCSVSNKKPLGKQNEHGRDTEADGQILRGVGGFGQLERTSKQKPKWLFHDQELTGYQMKLGVKSC